jgi:diguanylate cyclase (GGDEF)-like protein
VPEANFAKTIQANNRNTLMLLSLVLLLGVAAFIWLTGMVTRPILQLEQSARKVAQHQLQTNIGGSFFSEFNQLAESFNRMINQLQASLRLTEQAQSRLEEEVAQRTEGLRRANAELETLSQHDSLTRLANRRRFDPAFDTEWYRAQRNHSPLALVMCDIDFFKKYNDLYGHLKGDDALSQVADCLAAAVTRAGDLVARFGGEEFAILLPDTTLQGALQVVEHVRDAVLERSIEHSNNPTGLLTISFGIALMDGDHPSLRPKHLLSEADKALYAAKAAGRNRVEIAGNHPDLHEA